MWIYIDETGNTGTNVFDPNQPVFLLGYVASRTNIDLLSARQIQRIARYVGQPYLHATEIPPDQVDGVCTEVATLVEERDVRFGFSRVSKDYLAVSKLFDTLFDPHENLEAPWLTYWVRPLRLMMVHKIASIVDEPLLQRFWNCLFQKNAAIRSQEFVAVCKDLQQRAVGLPDARSRELISQVTDWAIQNPNTITLRLTRTISLGHAPNLVAFMPLMGLMDRLSRLWRRPVRAIYHDRSGQFRSNLIEMHQVFSNAQPGPVTITVGQQEVLRRVPGSAFEMRESAASAGLQIIDLVLWLLNRIDRGDQLPPGAYRLLNYVMRRSQISDLSFASVTPELEHQIGEIMDAPFTPEDERRARDLIELDERRRETARQEYYSSNQ